LEDTCVGNGGGGRVGNQVREREYLIRGERTRMRLICKARGRAKTERGTMLEKKGGEKKGRGSAGP